MDEVAMSRCDQAWRLKRTGDELHIRVRACCRLAVLWLALQAGAAVALEPKVAVTIKPVHALVSQIMQGIATPSLIVGGSASPHTFTLKPSAARAISNADVFIRVSERVEPFTRKIVEALPKSVEVITLADVPGLTLLDQRHGGSFEAHVHAHDEHDHDHAHDDHAGHEHDDKAGNSESATKDGHIWLDPQNAKLIVSAVARVLAGKYPDAAASIDKNAAATLTKLDELSVEIARELEAVKGRPFIIFHDATQYFENRFGMPAAGSITVSPDVSPSAKRLTAVRKKIGTLDAVCVFAEPAFKPQLVAAVTEGTKARSGSLDAEGASLQPGPDLYFALMRALAHNLKTCLRGAG